MLATVGRRADVAAGHAYEFKWDGVRAIVSVVAAGVVLTSRRGDDVSHRYPELAGLADEIAPGSILDGEVVALDEHARPSFGLLQRRMNLGDPARIARAAATAPVVLMLFDLLRDREEDLLRTPYEDRRARLLGLGLGAARWQTPPHSDDLDATIGTAARLDLEGVVAKRLRSPYRPGVRSPDWRKLRLVRRQEFVVGGWSAGRGSRSDSFGSLLVGYHDDDGLRFAGRVGSGFKEADLATLLPALQAIERPDSPFVRPPPDREAHHVEPRLVVDVQFKQWTRDGILRAPSFRGVRDDRDPTDVIREPDLVVGDV